LSARWWLAVILAAFVGVWLPGRLFNPLPHGTVSAQVWTVVLKLAATYVLAIGTWVLLLAWVATLFGRQASPPVEEALVAVPVLTGPQQGKHGATAEIPPPDEDIAE
jgi:hypothetical protein